MYAYADQNFLSTCAGNPVWRDAVIRARCRDTATLVLSPWHFYELGNAQPERREGLLQLAEDAKPGWTFTQADLQLLEFISEWKNFWGEGPTTFHPICTLHEAAAALRTVHPKHLQRFTLRDWVSSFASEDRAHLWDTMDSIRRAAATNQKVYQQGRMTRDILRTIDRKHVAVQLARVERNGHASEALKRGNQLLIEQPIGTKIDFFVDFGGVKDLRCYQVESALATNMWASDAKLRKNRYIDRQHATVAMSYCDRFVTDDHDLIRRCKAARRALNFPTAEVQKGEEFIQSLLSATG